MVLSLGNRKQQHDLVFVFLALVARVVIACFLFVCLFGVSDIQFAMSPIIFIEFPSFYPPPPLQAQRLG